MKTFIEWYQLREMDSVSQFGGEFNPNDVRAALISGEMSRVDAYQALVNKGRINDDRAEEMISQWLAQHADAQRPEPHVGHPAGSFPMPQDADHHSFTGADRARKPFDQKVGRSGYGKMGGHTAHGGYDSSRGGQGWTRPEFHPERYKDEDD